MKILARILALFLIMPVVELFLLVQLEKLADDFTGGYGLLFTLAVIFVTGVLGSYLAKREGLSVWNRLQSRLDEGGLPGKELLDGVIILIAGALLITPGVLTDFFGFIGLIPFTRAGVRKLVMKRIKRAVKNGTIQTGFGGFGSASAWDAPDEAGGAFYAGEGFPEEGFPAEDFPPEGRTSKHQGEAAWRGAPRDVPGHAEEVGQTRARGQERDAIKDQ